MNATRVLLSITCGIASLAVLSVSPVGGQTPTVRSDQHFVIHPDFESNRLIYLSYSKPNADGSQATTAIARARFEGDRLTNLEEIFEARAWASWGNHLGSRIQFGAEGYLFFTVGDRGVDPAGGPREAHPAQDLSSHQGTVIRLHDDGRVPVDNPFVGRPGAPMPLVRLEPVPGS